MVSQIPIGDPGVAYLDTEEHGQIEIWTGKPPTISTTEPVDTQTLALYEVVGLDGSGNIIPAVLGTTAAVGIMSRKVGTSDTKAAIWRDGVWNPNALVWDATYDTDEKKRVAFQGAPAPTAIIIQPNEYDPTFT